MSDSSGPPDISAKPSKTAEPEEVDAKLILGVDGGGTKTVACIARSDPQGSCETLGRGQAGSTNLKAVGPEVARNNLMLAIELAWQDAEHSATTADFAVLGLSGAGLADAQQWVQQWILSQGVAREVQIVHDALPVLAAGSDEGWGVALIAGTGTVALGANQAGEACIVGGWGYWFGDEGSAYWLGREALRRISHAADGRGSDTALTQLVLKRLGIDDPRRILSALEQQGDVRLSIAGLAELVCAAASHDPPAELIVGEAARHLADLVSSVASNLHLPQGFPLAVAGGVLTGSADLRNRLLKELRQLDLIPTSIKTVNDPVAGCLRLALRALSGSS